MATFQDGVVDFLTRSTVTREDVDRFLDPETPKWATFDPELGYVPHPSEVPDGVGGAVSTYRYGARGERFVVNYPDRASRISSYGDSFTQCHQVSDGETWQEALAARFGEPIRNYGVGGYGVYQAYLRLRRVEAIEPASHLLFNIFFDDHFRNLDAYRLLRVGVDWLDDHRSLATSMFHANPWRHLRYNASGELVERPNPCPTPESLYDLCDHDFLIDTFADDFVVQLLVARRLGESERLASLEQRYSRYAFDSSISILQRLRTELAETGTKLLVLLSYPDHVVAAACRGTARPDADFVRVLDELGLPYVDSLAAHVADYADFSISPEDYVKRYYYDHYTPTGNQFFASAIEPAIRDWLTP